MNNSKRIEKFSVMILISITSVLFFSCNIENKPIDFSDSYFYINGTNLYFYDRVNLRTTLIQSSVFGGASWSPDGKKLSYIKTVLGIRQVFICNYDGTGETQLTSDADNGKNSTAWSGDNKKIFYATTTTYNIMSVDFNRQQKIVVTHGGTISDLCTSPSSSPDGRKLAFVAQNGAVTDLFVKNLETGVEEQLTTFINASSPTWSSDGTKIAYCVAINSIHIFNLITRTDNLLPPSGLILSGSISWSLDQNKLIYTSNGDTYEYSFIDNSNTYFFSSNYDVSYRGKIR